MSVFPGNLASLFSFANMQGKSKWPGTILQAVVSAVLKPMRKCAASGFSPEIKTTKAVLNVFKGLSNTVNNDSFQV